MSRYAVFLFVKILVCFESFIPVASVAKWLVFGMAAAAKGVMLLAFGLRSLIVFQNYKTFNI